MTNKEWENLISVWIDDWDLLDRRFPDRGERLERKLDLLFQILMRTKELELGVNP